MHITTKESIEMSITYKAIPPPNKTFYSYTQGFPIQKIDIPQIQKDSYGIPRGIVKVLQGGVGQTTWSAEFVPTITKYTVVGGFSTFFTTIVIGTVGDTVVGRVEGRNLDLAKEGGWSWERTASSGVWPNYVPEYLWSPQWIEKNRQAFPE